ncbi:hypothetical protein PHYBLDRAFT_123082 [Phycomyces blakesleeanus NRRL 1555(-)]|uniref:Spermatogenesis-associated protein 20-like TRX domain-containing protein n=1 Tax=Phycomyces blakesleeanus (strain ATCC 8743b / DSM 1359 / FGSC 10004 / NBRC 33097 / NRRL 1555) TaxID=763407 RepID=A0A162PY63_PHYB8|nr:hypothetical protein PHYBLDRAFT_123082 [Phycomyces blakesleeanus NRRL 1555(-)]OAD77087.1 hypothetical protein PHYBLDRAFT_123082 [Phycomyces blakesleeanus NRRL 1555(-)]|eukprot:XP_018295127.1 hypothetical protein PHYBLDRAFT_123082 [Phycomyces blakesleeanus NRRL 1555(-)]
MTSLSNHKNRLWKEKSPYLLQHANNPVDWYPWGEEAFEKAKQEQKPIFISIGYSTCHWCHVMEHESFESEETAKLMNDSFVNIKVDREENPGVDKFYMTYLQMTTGSGGWPMSVFLTPERYPFFGGTYFPPKDRLGKPGFQTIVSRLAQLWKSQADKIRSDSKSSLKDIKDYIEAKLPSSSKELDPWKIAEATYDYFEKVFDSTYGGFGEAPKFPTPVQLLFLLDYHMYTKNESSEHYRNNKAQNALEMVLKTLKNIGIGGIHDHVGGGFHRYSTDRMWHVPHFEKMLYDQAQLLSVYTKAFQITNDSIYSDIAKDIILYVSQNLLHEEGGFYSAEDADSYPKNGDSKKLEGAFCTWELDEIDGLLEPKISELFKRHFGVKEGGNVTDEQDPQKELENKNILMEQETIDQSASALSIPVESAKTLIADAKDTLRNYRLSVRPRPDKDDKILTCWNGLILSALSQAYLVFHDKSILKLATDTAYFIKKELYIEEKNILLRSYREGPSTIEGFSDDYSFFIQGLLDLYEATFDDQWLQWSYALQEKQNELFYDNEKGGYFNISEKDTSVPMRLKEDQDGSEPTANSVSLRNLIRLGTVFEIPGYFEKAKQTAESFRLILTQFPYAIPAVLSSFLLFSEGLKEIIIVGPTVGDDTPSSSSHFSSLSEKKQRFEAIIARPFIPNKFVASLTPDGILAKKNPLFEEIVTRHKNSDDVAVYVCENFTCRQPIFTEEELEKTMYI